MLRGGISLKTSCFPVVDSLLSTEYTLVFVQNGINHRELSITIANLLLQLNLAYFNGVFFCLFVCVCGLKDSQNELIQHLFLVMALNI